jgi:hypothetical protein
MYLTGEDMPPTKKIKRMIPTSFHLTFNLLGQTFFSLPVPIPPHQGLHAGAETRIPKNFEVSFFFFFRLSINGLGKNRIQPPKKFNLLSITIFFFLFLIKKKLKTQQGSGY